MVQPRGSEGTQRRAPTGRGCFHTWRWAGPAREPGDSRRDGALSSRGRGDRCGTRRSPRSLLTRVGSPRSWGVPCPPCLPPSRPPRRPFPGLGTYGQEQERGGRRCREAALRRPPRHGAAGAGLGGLPGAAAARSAGASALPRRWHLPPPRCCP